MKKGFLCALVLGLLLPGCAKQTPAVSVAPAAPPEPSSAPVATPAAGSVAEGKELFCLADTEEEAKELAALYGITLVDFRYGVASFHTEEDPASVIARGKKNGWPSLSLNTVITLDDPVKEQATEISKIS